jgi:hypothetical protein
MVIDFIQFMLNLILAGFVLRYVQVKTHGSELGKALAYVY